MRNDSEKIGDGKQADYHLIEKLSEVNRQLSEDIARRECIEQQLLCSEERYRMLFESSGDALFVLKGRKIIDCNDAAIKLFHFADKNSLLAATLTDCFANTQADSQKGLYLDNVLEINNHNHCQRFEWQGIKKDGELFPIDILLNQLPYETEKILQLVCRDISARKKAEAEAAYLAYYDPLTGLPNRRLFIDRLEHCLKDRHRLRDKLALLFIDLDKFKNINDSCGHATGDQLLKSFSERINSMLRASDTFSRIGGDEFVILLENLDPRQHVAITHANKLANKLITSLAEPFQLDSGDCHVTASIGVMVFPLSEETTESVLQKADIAMYLAKQKGRNRIQLFDLSMHEEIDEKILLENDLHKALNNDELSLVYQPQFNRQYNAVSVEALCRWNHPLKGHINPNLFISIAEENGLIVKLGRRVLEQAIIDIQAINRQSAPDQQLKLSVNVSPVQFEHPDFIQEVADLVSLYKVEKDFLTLEITENTFMSDLSNMCELIEQVKHYGINVSLDDFGTGFSSLSYLKQLPIDELKIDTSFIKDMEKNNDDAMLVKSILAIGQHFKFEVVAEGVETMEHLKLLEAHDCDLFQGYYFARPMEKGMLLDFLQSSFFSQKLNTLDQ